MRRHELRGPRSTRACDEVARAVEGRGVPRLLDASRGPGRASAARKRDRPAVRRLAGRPHAGGHLRDGGGSMPSCAWPGDPWLTSLGVGPGFETMPVGAAVGIPADRRCRRTAGEGERVQWNGGRRGYASRSLPVGTSSRWRPYGRSIRTSSSRPTPTGRTAWRPIGTTRMRRFVGRAGRIRRALCGATAAARRPGGPRRAAPAHWRAHLPGRVAFVPSAGARCPAQRGLPGGLPQAGAPGRHAGRPAGPRRLCRPPASPVFVGGFFEAGLGRAANLALAARLAQRRGRAGR